MSRINYRTKSVFLTALGLLAVALAACGGGNGDSSSPQSTSPAGGSSQQPTPVPPTATPIPQDSAVQSLEETGLAVENIELEAGSFGGTVRADVTNNADTPCNGAVILVSLLREDGTQAGEVGLLGQKIDPGETKKLKDRYFGTVAKAAVSSATCEASVLSDASAPDRAQTPEAGK